MSAGNPTPMLTLVREDTLTTSESGSLRYAAGASQPATYDEIKLQTPRGEGAATPLLTHRNRDIEHELIDGGLTWTKRVISGQIDLAVDYIDNGTRRRLERWMMDRARVLFSPGHGTGTELYWRPRYLAASANDLTNKWMITSNHDITSAWVWDAENGGIMRFFNTTVAKTIKTDFGAGQVFSGSSPNLFYAGTPPGSYPVGSSDADSGWERWGTMAGDVSVAYVANGFGCTDCPGSLRAYSPTAITGDGVNGVSLGRVLPASVTGAGTVHCGVFLKGRLSSTATISLETNNGFSRSVALSTMDLSRWTFVHVEGYWANWPGTTNTLLKINLTSGTGVKEACDLQVGPSVACFEAGTVGDSMPQWLRSSRTVPDYLSVSNFVLPRSGSVTFVMYVPKSMLYDVNRATLVSLSSNVGVSTFKAYVYHVEGATTATMIFYYGTDGSDYYSATFPAATFFSPGSVQSIAVTWGSSIMSAYLNGALLSTRAGSVMVPPSATTLRLWGLDGTQSVSSLVPLSVRIDNIVLSADSVADMHATVSNKASAGLVASARGRVYQIEEIPSIPRTCDTGTNWVGNLRLRQVEYVSSLADITTKEG